MDFWANNTKYISKKVLDKLDPVESYDDYHQEYENKNAKIEE